ncbi:MAG: S41 family peptidase [Nitrospirae bacterium]|nr:S41 family peptidase [Magnetococcales bacterium]HAT50909.1 peptidase S41 [Alphaproteobacteria bacterium]
MKGFLTGPRPYLFAAFILALLLGLNLTSTNVMAVSQVTYEKLRVFSEVFRLIKQNYVEDVDEKTILYGAIQGMLKALDPHSSFLNPENFKEMRVDTKGEFGGLGIEITHADRGIRVVSPIEDTPAFEVGMKAGDLIIKIEEESTEEMELMDAVKKMRGKPGTAINLTVMRQGEPKPLVFKITRAIIKIRSVKWRLESDKIGYVRIIQFNEQTYPLLQEAIADLSKSAGAKLKGLVLDLRNDPGGLLDQAVQVADGFLDKGNIVYTKGRIEGKDMSFEAQEGDLVAKTPMVVLINTGSASASEIVAGALQDHHRAVIMGTRSFGKGSVQTIIPLSDGSGLRLTTAKYYTPSGRSIQAKGIEPDIIVEDLDIGGLRKNLPSTTEADLRGHLEDGDATKSPTKKPKKESTTEEKKETLPSDKEAVPSDLDRPEKTDESKTDESEINKDQVTGRSKEDYQLQRALDLLRGFQVLQSQLSGSNTLNKMAQK